MDTPPETQSEQAKQWNGAAGRAWVDAQILLDRLFMPFQDLLIDAVVRSGAVEVLDVGCGTGSTTLALAQCLGAKGHARGLDISAPMLTLARSRAEEESTGATFVNASAETHTFEPPLVDHIVSRFGVMFFDDPIRAFKNLRRAAAKNASLTFVAWRSAAENPFMTTAERAAAPMLPNLPVRKVDGPGQFAFADRARVQTILDASGWKTADIHEVDVPCAMSVSELDFYMTRIGPVGMLLQDTDEVTRARVVKAVRAAFAPFSRSHNVSFTAACWLVNAKA